LLPVESRRALLRLGMTHLLGSIRNAALRRYKREGFDDVRDVLIAALLDRNSSVRGAAAYGLERDFAFAAVPVWRETFDAGRNCDAMTAALAESGDASDGDRLRSQLVSKRGRVRATALQGLLRIGVSDAHALLVQALRDPSNAVARAAARAYSRGGETLDDSTLREAFDTADNPRLRSRYINLSPLLPKWSRLTFLLSLYGKAHPDELHLLDRQVNHWISKANRSYAQPGEQLRTELAQLIEELRALHPAPFWKELRHLL
jgi:HEAT repeat protein